MKKKKVRSISSQIRVLSFEFSNLIKLYRLGYTHVPCPKLDWGDSLVFDAVQSIIIEHTFLVLEPTLLATFLSIFS